MSIQPQVVEDLPGSSGVSPATPQQPFCNTLSCSYPERSTSGTMLVVVIVVPSVVVYVGLCVFQYFYARYIISYLRRQAEQLQRMAGIGDDGENKELRDGVRKLPRFTYWNGTLKPYSSGAVHVTLLVHGPTVDEGAGEPVGPHGVGSFTREVEMSDLPAAEHGNQGSVAPSIRSQRGLDSQRSDTSSTSSHNCVQVVVDIHPPLPENSGDLESNGDSVGASSRNAQRGSDLVRESGGDDASASLDPSSIVMDSTCAVCLEEWCNGDVLVGLPCKHAFHLGCINGWAIRQPVGQERCPLCSRQLTTQPSASSPQVARVDTDAGETEGQ